MSQQKLNVNGSYLDLKEALKTMLKNKGTIDQVKAQIRAELFAEINADERSRVRIAKTPPPRETIILNELFREYLQFHGYEQTLSVFLSETSQPVQNESIDRKFIMKELGFASDMSHADIPLVYALVDSYKDVCSMQQTLAPMVGRMSQSVRSPGNMTSAEFGGSVPLRTQDLTTSHPPNEDPHKTYFTNRTDDGGVVDEGDYVDDDDNDSADIDPPTGGPGVVDIS